MLLGTKNQGSEFDAHRSPPVVGAAITSRLAFDVAKFSSSQLLFRLNSMHGPVGMLDVHSSIPTSKRRLNAVQYEGKGTRYHSPNEVTFIRIGEIDTRQAASSLQSKWHASGNRFVGHVTDHDASMVADNSRRAAQVPGPPRYRIGPVRESSIEKPDPSPLEF